MFAGQHCAIVLDSTKAPLHTFKAPTLSRAALLDTLVLVLVCRTGPYCSLLHCVSISS